MLQKQLDDRYADLIKGAADVYGQDNLRKQKKADLARFTSSYVAFEGKNTPWDVSLVEDEFAHNTNESMLVNWENQERQEPAPVLLLLRRQAVEDVHLARDLADPRGQEELRVLPAGPRGQVRRQAMPTSTPSIITWRAGDFDARAIDKLKSYDALCMSLEDPAVSKDMSSRCGVEEGAGQEGDELDHQVGDRPIFKGDDHPDTKQNANAVDAVLNADGASAPKKKAPAPTPTSP